MAEEESVVPEVEQTALSQGWKPKEDWVEGGGNPDEWRSAREFVDRGELLKQIHTTNRKAKQLETGLLALKQHHQFVFEKAHKQALEDLKKERRAAFVNEDLEAVEHIEEKIEQTREEFEKSKQKMDAEVTVPSNEPPAEFVAWQGRNSWYESDVDLHDFADALGMAYSKRNPTATPTQVLKHVEDQVKSKFPEKTGGKRAAPNPVSAVDKTSSSRSTKGDIQLTDTEREIMTNLVRQGVLTEAEYKAELKKVRD